MPKWILVIGPIESWKWVFLTCMIYWVDKWIIFGHMHLTGWWWFDYRKRIFFLGFRSLYSFSIWDFDTLKLVNFPKLVPLSKERKGERILLQAIMTKWTIDQLGFVQASTKYKKPKLMKMQATPISLGE